MVAFRITCMETTPQDSLHECQAVVARVGSLLDRVAALTTETLHSTHPVYMTSSAASVVRLQHADKRFCCWSGIRNQEMHY